MKNLVSKWQFNCTNMYGSESKEKDTINEWFEISTIRNTVLLKQRLSKKNILLPNPGLSFVVIQQHKWLFLDSTRHLTSRYECKKKSYLSEIPIFFTAAIQIIVCLTIKTSLQFFFSFLYFI